MIKFFVKFAVLDIPFHRIGKIVAQLMVFMIQASKIALKIK